MERMVFRTKYPENVLVFVEGKKLNHFILQQGFGEINKEFYVRCYHHCQQEGIPLRFSLEWEGMPEQVEDWNRFDIQQPLVGRKMTTYCSSYTAYIHPQTDDVMVCGKMLGAKDCYELRYKEKYISFQDIPEMVFAMSEIIKKERLRKLIGE